MQHYRKFYILLGFIFFLGLVFVQIMPAPPSHPRFQSMAILGQLSKQLSLYAYDNEGAFPNHTQWILLRPHIHDSDSITYIPNFIACYMEEGISTAIVAWRKEKQRIFVLLSSLGDPIEFNFAKGELPDFYPYIKGTPQERVMNVTRYRENSGQSILLLQLMFHDNENALATIASGKNINQADVNGITPLMRAVSNQNILLVQKLLEQGADKSIKNIWGDTAIDIAQKRENKKIISLLNENKKNSFIVNRRSHTFVYNANLGLISETVN